MVIHSQQWLHSHELDKNCLDWESGWWWFGAEQQKPCRKRTSHPVLIRWYFRSRPCCPEQWPYRNTGWSSPVYFNWVPTPGRQASTLAIRERWFACMGGKPIHPCQEVTGCLYPKQKQVSVHGACYTWEPISRAISALWQVGQMPVLFSQVDPSLGAHGILCLIKVIGTAIFHLRPVHYRDLSTATMIHGQWRQWPSSTRLLDLCLASACLGRCHTSYF